MQLLQTARRHFETGGDRMRFTYPALITASIKLCRQYKNREHMVCSCRMVPVKHVTISFAVQEDEWQSKVATILKFVRQIISILHGQVEAPNIALRLFLLAAQIADECGFENLAYDFYVQAFTVYEESISESRAQLQAITLIIGTLQGAKVFSIDNYDTLITKAALHGARLLKKPHQATAVGLASHLWWQEVPAEEELPGADKVEPVETATSSTNEESDGPKAVCIGAIVSVSPTYTIICTVPAPR